MARLLKHPAFGKPAARRGFLAVLLLRSAFFAFLVFLFDSIVELGTTPYAGCLAAASGVAGGSMLAFSRFTALAMMLCVGGVYLGLEFLLFLASMLPIFAGSVIFTPFIIHQHAVLLLLVFALAFFSTLAFWRLRLALTLEVVGLLALGIYLLRGHRNFRLDAPKAVSALAWDFALDPLTMLVGIGAFIVITLLLFVSFSSLPGRPAGAGANQQIALHRGAPNLPMWALLIAALGLYLTILGRAVYNYYHATAASRTANGVGQVKKDGISPLTFHSALGTSNQPSGIVRLEGDYMENPHKPNLYLREAALSRFDGQQLVPAGAGFDSDVSFSPPQQTYLGTEDAELISRVPLVQSVYLLADHTNAFAVDYPLSLKRLKNPEPGKFKATYRAYSVAPGYKLSDVAAARSDDPRWSEELRRHYLAPHPDPRYAELATKISSGAAAPFAKANAIIDYLSTKSIYTLAPNHDVKPEDDQTAPYLFGDMRGYCVHFAHATVYLLRALGIPARIATGYLTDLSQSKDGHILLRMSDRHSWAEAYFEGFGWIPFDTHPTQVESHAETPVDMQLLEELMGLLEPGEEILPEDVAKDELNVEAPSALYIPTLRDVLVVLLGLTAFLVICKSYLRYSWLIARRGRGGVRRAYIALVSRLYDLGYRRGRAETRHEFRERLGQELEISVLSITSLLSAATYAPGAGKAITGDEVTRAMRMDRQSTAGLSPMKRILAALSPASVIAFCVRHKW